MAQIKCISGEELSRILVETKNIRDRLIFCLMGDAGLRVGETVKLPISSMVLFDNICANVAIPAEITKSKKARFVPMTNRLKICVSQAHETIWKRSNRQSHNFAFFSNNPDKHLTTRTVERKLLLVTQQLLTKDVTPHMLRHTFATRMMKHVSSRIVQELLGHANLSSTQIYTHPNSNDLSDAVSFLNQTAI